MNRVLIITYHFPPYRTGGVYRHLKFCKYLRDFSREPYVLTVKNPSKQLLDLSLMKDVPNNLSLYKTLSIEPDGLRNAVERLIDRNNSFSSKPKLKMINGINKILKKYLLIPDDKVGWIPHTLIKAIHIMKKNGIGIVCTTSPPHSTHLIGLFLKLNLKCRWIADFRDPWLYSFMNKLMYENLGYRQRLEKNMEKCVFKYADRIITVTEGVRKRYRKLYGKEVAEKISLITNGYDGRFQYNQI